MHRLCAYMDAWGYSDTSEGALIGQGVWGGGGRSFPWLQRTIAINHPSFFPSGIEAVSIGFIFIGISLKKKKKHHIHTIHSALPVYGNGFFPLLSPEIFFWLFFLFQPP